MTPNELRQQRAELIRKAREILELAERENRSLTEAENGQYGQHVVQITEMGERITRLEEQQRLEDGLRAHQTEPVRTPPGQAGQTGQRVERHATPEYAQAFEQWLRGGMAVLAPEENRALQADIDTVGGYLRVPEQLIMRLIKGLDDMVFIRRLATKFTVPTADSLGVPSLDADPADAEWTSELATGSEDTAMAFGKRNLHPHPLAKRIKISNKLIRVATIGAEPLVRDRLTYKFGISEEKGFLTGTGAQQPLGVFTASADGIPTGRDVSIGNTTNEIRFDGLIEAKFTLKGQYWSRARWAWHRDALKQITRLKDGEGQYIWRESARVGEPDRILGLGYDISEYVPNTFTSGLYVGILGDFSNYWIVDALAMQIQRLVELYAETNQVGFIGRKETDGAPVLSEAFVRVKLA